MGTALATLRTASAELGYREVPVNRVKYWADLYPVWQGAPWCATFVQWCLEQNGEDLRQEVPHPYYVPSFVAWAKKAGRWSETPTSPGDLVVMGRDKSYSHIGFLERVHDDYVTTLEGNTSSGPYGSQNDGGGVYRRNRSSYVRGYIRLSYDPAKQGSPFLTADGILDVPTIRRVQVMVGAKPDGQIGPDTRRRLQKWAKRPATGTFTTADIKAIQRKVGHPETGVWSYAWRSQPTSTTRAIEEYINRGIRKTQASA